MASPFTIHNAMVADDVNGPITINGDLEVTGTLTSTTGQSLDGAVTINESGAAVDFRVEGDTVTHMIFVDGSADTVSFGGTSLATSLLGVSSTGVVVNEVSNATTDFRAETGGVTHAIFADASADTVSFGGTGISDAWLQAAATGVIINENGADADFRVEGDTDPSLLHVDASADRVGINVAAPSAKVDIEQDDAAGAIVCLELNQDDLDVGFIDFVGTSTGDLNSPVSTFTTPVVTGHVRVHVNGATRWIAFSTTPTA